MGGLLLSVLGEFTVWSLISLRDSEGGGGKAEQWKERLTFCWSYALPPLPQLHATRPLLFSCAETDLSVCKRGQTDSLSWGMKSFQQTWNRQSSAANGTTEDPCPTDIPPTPFCWLHQGPVPGNKDQHNASMPLHFVPPLQLLYPK